MASDVGSRLVASPSTQLMPPPVARTSTGSKRPIVLDEDDWTEKIERIVERDFFPDIPKLQSKLEWLQAVRSRDPGLMRQAQLNIAQRRAGIRTPIGAATPATFATPGASMLRTPAGLTPAFMTPAGAFTATPGRSGAAAGGATTQGQAAAEDAVPDMPLDKFLAQHTSEDNASFAEIVEEGNKRRRVAKAWMYDTPAVPALEAPSTDANGSGDVERVTDGFGTSGQPRLEMVVWKHAAKNRLFYDASQHEVVPWTERELSNLASGPPKQIRHRNTRFIGAEYRGTGLEAPEAAEEAPAAAKAAQYGGGAPYSVVATPSFTPGVEESPFMTWGEIGGTPLRLEQEDTPVNIGGTGTGPTYAVPEVPRKDALGRSMAQKAAANLKRQTSARRGTPLAASLGRTPGTDMRTPGAPGMLSAAGKRLASSMWGGNTLGRAANADLQLRRSYKGTPGRATPAATPVRRPADTPSFMSPQQRSGVDSQRLIDTTKEGVISKLPEQTGRLTDNLLNI